MSFQIHSQPNTNISLDFIGVTLRGSDWKFNGLNILINISDLEKVKCISLIGQSKELLKSVNIFNSTLSNLYVQNGIVINVAHYNFNPFRETVSSILDVSNSLLTLPIITFSQFNSPLVSRQGM